MCARLETSLGLSSLCCLRRTTCTSLLLPANADYPAFWDFLVMTTKFPLSKTHKGRSTGFDLHEDSQNPNTRCLIKGMALRYWLPASRIGSFPTVIGHLRKKDVKGCEACTFSVPLLSASDIQLWTPLLGIRRRLTWWQAWTIRMCAGFSVSAWPPQCSSSLSSCLTGACWTMSKRTRTTSAPSTCSTGVCR